MRLLHRPVEHWAAIRPDAPAVDEAGAVWSYGELCSRMRRLAALLRRLGIARNNRVAVLMDNSAHAYQALLGILAADACFVPFNPGFPALRLADIAAQAEPMAVVTLSKHLPLLGDILGHASVESSPFVIVLDADAPPEVSASIPPSHLFTATDLARESDGFVPAQNREEDLAYILFTSGTTGRPKGVMLSHRAVMSVLRWSVDLWKLTPADRFANHSRLTFDVSMFDIFAGFLAGGTVCPIILAKDLTFPGDFIRKERISVWCSVPGVIGMMIKSRQLAAGPMDTLRLALFIGEALQTPWAAEWRRLQPDVPIWNTYGPTEAAIFCTAFLVDVDAPLDTAKPVPIGKPSTDCELFVLKTNSDALADAGEVGRLMITGTQLAHGYWRAPEITTRAFRPNPFKRDLGCLMYDTGDLAMMGEQGHLVWMGRADSQVKVRGYRVELGEIETVLHAAPEVHDAVVMLSTSGNDLVAAVIPEHGHETVSEENLQAFLAHQLPAYMIPARFLFLADFPRNDNGKVDRRQLQGRFD
ncbi:MAG: amino acid adenylation domain-containing protein [Alphaproteobacteria bacterium]|nr:amino acid adenylation domain-containing protein [Alphaproteobacteria bacterium]